MTPLIDHLRLLRYPGRFIVLGLIGDTTCAIYAATGRSASSRARRYIQDERGDVWAVGTDKVVAEEGNPELLEYRAVRWMPNGVVVANGRQIEDEWETCEPEPDAYLTPRITVVVEEGRATLFVSRSVDGKTERKVWPLQLADGVGYYIATYDGIDARPMGSFFGEPVPVELNFKDIQSATQSVFDALQPPTGEADYRVGVVGVLMQDPTNREVAIVNKS